MPHPAQGYRNAEGIRVPGTTTIIGRFKDSGALLWWAFEQGKAAERGEITSLYDKRDEAASNGTLAHEIVEAHIKGLDICEAVSAAPEAVQSSVKAYLKWESMTKLKIVEQEISLVSEKYQFGGTPDAIGEIDGELCMIDWKTSKSVYQDMLIQIAAYDILWHENYPDRPLTGGFHLCKFSKKYGDFSHHYWPELESAKRQFILLREAYDLDKELKNRAA